MPDSTAQQQQTEDVFANALNKINQYKREIGVVVLIVLAAGVIYAIAQQSQQKADMAAWADLHKAEIQAGAPMGTISPADLQNLKEKHADSHAAPYIAMQNIHALAEEGENAEAAGAAQRFLKKYPNHAFSPMAELALAQALSREEKWTDAKVIFNKVKARTQIKGNEYLEPEARLGYAHCLAREAEAARGTPQYTALLDAAREAYLDITGKADWPQSITEQARIASIVIRERLRQAETDNASGKAGPETTNPADASAESTGSETEPEAKTPETDEAPEDGQE